MTQSSQFRMLGVLTGLAIGAAGCGGAPEKSPKTAATADKSEAPEATPLASGGFALDFKIWHPDAHSDPKRLVVTYQWGSNGAHTLEAQRQNDRWHFEFPDQPKPQEVASLKLRYEFALSEADRAEIHEAARTILRGVLQAVQQAKKAEAAEKSAAPATSPKSEAASDEKVAAPAAYVKSATATKQGAELEIATKEVTMAETAAKEAKAREDAANEAATQAKQKVAAARDAKEKDKLQREASQKQLAAKEAGIRVLAAREAVKRATAKRDALIPPEKEAPLSAATTAATNDAAGTAGAKNTAPQISAAAAAAVATRFAQASKALAAQDAAAKLRQYGATGGADGLTVVLEHLGIEQNVDGTWNQTETGRQLLRNAANDWTDVQIDALTSKISSYAAKLVKVNPTPDENACKAPAGDMTKLDEPVAGALLSACAGSFEALARTVDTTAPAGAAKKANAVAPLMAAVNRLKTAKPDLTPAAIQTLDEEPAAEIDELELGEPALAASYSFLAMRLAESTLRRMHRALRQRQVEDALLASIDAAFEIGNRTEDGSTLVSGAARPRRYDIATGFVYVAGLDNLIVPMLVSICLSDGCLAADDVAWSATHGWLRAFSFDAGIRVKTLDTQDLRQSDKISFLLGMSFNPVTILRVSGGFYAFENAQTRAWNGQGYVGVTLNVLNAAAIFGGLGLGDQIAPSTTPVK